MLKIELLFRNEHGRCARRQTDIERQMARVSAHDLDDRAALVRLHGVSETVDSLDGGVGRGVVADGVIGADDVIVDGCRYADNADPLLGKLLEAAERAVAADADDAVESQKLARGRCALLTFECPEFFAAGCIEHRAAAVYNVVDAVFIEPDKIAVDESIESAPDADAVDAAVDGRADDRTDGCVHTGRVAAGGEHANSLDCIRHKKVSLLSNIFLTLPYHTNKEK